MDIMHALSYYQGWRNSSILYSIPTGKFNKISGNFERALQPGTNLRISPLFRKELGKPGHNQLPSRCSQCMATDTLLTSSSPGQAV